MKALVLGIHETPIENEVAAPSGGFKTRSEAARDIRIRLAQRERQKKAEKSA